MHTAPRPALALEERETSLPAPRGVPQPHPQYADADDATYINLLEYPILTTASVCPSQKPSHGDISGTKLGIIDPLVSNFE